MFSWINPLTPFVLSSDCIVCCDCCFVMLNSSQPSVIVKIPNQEIPLAAVTTFYQPQHGRVHCVGPRPRASEREDSRLSSTGIRNAEGMGRCYGAYIENTEIRERIVYLRVHETIYITLLLFPIWNSIVYQTRG